MPSFVSNLSRVYDLVMSQKLFAANWTISGPANMCAIFDAILRNDPDAAPAACRAHINEAARIAESLLAPEIPVNLA